MPACLTGEDGGDGSEEPVEPVEDGPVVRLGAAATQRQQRL